MSPQARTDMEKRWLAFVRRARLSQGEFIWPLLYKRYDEPGRHYHNLAHIRHCLVELDAVRRSCPEPLCVEAGIWFHDAVYDPDRKDNEFLSAEFAATKLKAKGMRTRDINLIKKLILDTRHQELPKTPAGKFMVDIDLSGLGQTPARFSADGRNVRAEYPHLDDATFNKGRVALFERLLARPSIYATDTFRDRYEMRARRNMLRTLRDLGADGKMTA